MLPFFLKRSVYFVKRQKSQGVNLPWLFLCSETFFTFCKKLRRIAAGLVAVIRVFPALFGIVVAVRRPADAASGEKHRAREPNTETMIPAERQNVTQRA